MFQEILSQEDIKKIHQTSVRILSDVGVEFPSQEALAAFQRHDIKTDGSRVYITEDQLWKALKMAPAHFTLHGRNPERSVTIGEGGPVFAPGYGAPFLIDADGNKRVPTVDDYRDLVRLAHALPNQDVSGHLLAEPGDVPPEKAPLHMVYAHIVHSDKPFLGSVDSELGVGHTLALARILFGESMDERAVTMGVVSSLTPLGYSREMIHAILRYAQEGQALLIANLAMAGSTAPVTLAGLLAMQSAELLAGIVLAQTVRPGTPVIYGTTSTNIDMRTGSLAIGSPELAQVNAVHMQLARFYGLPSRGSGALTDANYPNAQAGLESMMGMLTTVNSGADFVLHAAGILSSYLAFSYEKFVLDDEICGRVRWFHRPLVVDTDTLAYESIARVGPGGHFLMEDQTLERCRTEFWTPEVSDRTGLDEWTGAGKPDSVARARDRWQQLVAAHQDPPLDRATARQLEAFVEEQAG
ncbi:MAG: trimethylamine--corrinoid methyltransferase [Armatimonadia bacterium]|nr:trimethylamine--corrinoid methyltransferase [Armatimonadia bacterium]